MAAPSTSRRTAPAATRAFIACALALAAAPSAARAQSAPPAAADPVAAEARQGFQRGVAAMDEGRYADAVSAFEASYRARPVPVVRYNLGLAYRGLGRHAAAVEQFERYLAETQGEASAATAAELRAEIARLRATLVRVRVTTRPADAALLVDGRATTAAGGVVILDPGSHVVEVSADGYRTNRREINGAPGAEVLLDVTLESLTGGGRLLVEASVPTGTITIDGEPAGLGRAERAMSEGSHLVEIRARGYEPFRRTLRVGPTGLVRLDAHLTREGGDTAWVLPVALGGGALAVGGIILGVVLASQGGPRHVPNLYEPSLGNVFEQR